MQCVENLSEVALKLTFNKILLDFLNVQFWRDKNIQKYLLEPGFYTNWRKKYILTVTSLWSRGHLKDVNDSKLTLNEPK